eukprot:TRINITY_DN19943_c0_g1_i1.p1 TRINITY_DN19943_c0_g1~~TRINITY_DN19943_c0_g1_i1.p1  ORF type:complete len:158 (+),score=31.60 TRINITY_DN19943_c0_g1_i1:148-621(+)
MAEKVKLVSEYTPTETYNLVVIGDGAVGKTCMLTSYSHNKFPDDYEPTVFDNYVVTVDVGEQSVDLSLRDTAGQEDLSRVRILSYHGAHIFLVCFSVANPTSFANVDKWVEDIREFDVTIPFVLVGTQLDLRTNPDTIAKLKQKGHQPITTAVSYTL